MKRIISVLTVLAVMVAMLVVMAMPAFAKSNPAKEACKQGGFANLTTGVGEAPFKNQGQCIKFVNQGGTLVPVV